MFPEGISIEAQTAIKIMLNPNPKLRPFAKDILNMDFFAKNTPEEELEKPKTINTNQLDYKALYE